MWNRRNVLGSCLLLAASSGIARAQAPGMPGMGMPGMGQGPMTRESCIDICIKSHRMCLETARYCSEKGSAHVAPTHLALLLDCAELCQTTANSLMRRSPQHGAICSACAQLCDACANDCETIAGDEQMAHCASLCRDCARDCRAMVNMPI